MEKYSQNELDETVRFISSTISKCEKMQLKFVEGTSQHSLLKNRIKALYISKALIKNDINISMYTKEDLEKALPPVVSIINKTEKAQIKYEEGTAQFRRFAPIIRAMYISKDFIENELEKRGEKT
ncbi:MAG: hypothetical protein KIC66_10910 [Clostridium sp.]|uniref:hypothetical protein n=1 Tax=Clostridium sp. TaxID=1506 RepID=UPI0025C6CBAF|nr:hypothetical protein [Clostridium sp.]MBS5927579.1 hypothetical protein [Clostridium sp.]